MSWGECLISPAACAASEGQDALTDSAWNSFLRWMAKGLTELSSYVFNAFSLSTAPQFDQPWWRQNLKLMITISLPLLVAAFVIQCASAVIRREPGRLGRAVLGAVLGTAGVPFVVAIIATCGRAVDQISTAILSGPATTDGLKRMLDITSLLTTATLGGFLITAVGLALLATIALYFVMLIREVALVAFVVFAPIAMASWTWDATRHWLRRWVEVVGALLFSKIAMAVVFTLGLSAAGNVDQTGDTSIGTFLTGILLFAMAAFAPLATYSFIHWAGDQGHAALHAVQQGAAGPSAVRERVENAVGRAQHWGAHHFGGSNGKDDSGPVVGDDGDPSTTAVASQSDDIPGTGSACTADDPVAPSSGPEPTAGGPAAGSSRARDDGPIRPSGNRTGDEGQRGGDR